MPDPVLRRPGGSMLSDQLAREALSEVEAAVAPTTPAIETPKVEQSPDPLVRWNKAIEAAGLSRDEALQIMDAQIDPGYWTKTYKLFGGRVEVTFRTRTAANRRQVMRELDAVQNLTQLAYAQTVSYTNLMNSLHQYVDKTKNKTFDYPTLDTTPSEAERMIEERAAFISRRISEPVLDAIYQKLGDFDGKVAAAMSEGAIESF